MTPPSASAVSPKAYNDPASSRVGAEAAPVKIPSSAAWKRWMRDYYAVCVLGLFAFSLIGAVGFLKPTIDDIKAVRALTEGTLADAERERAYLASLDRSVAAAQSIPPAALERVAAALPPATDAPSLLVQLHEAARRSGVKIVSLSVTEPRVAATGAGAANAARATVVEPRQVEISLGVGARNYLDVKRLLAELEANIRLMDVQGLNTAGFQPGEEAMFSLQLRAYTYPSPEKKP